VLVFVLILLVLVLFHWEMGVQNDLKVVDQPAAQYDTLVADQRAKLASYRLLDPQKNIVQIPISRAMDMVVEDLQKSPQNASPKQSPPDKEADHGSK
jgi:hypothetical protein